MTNFQKSSYSIITSTKGSNLSLFCKNVPVPGYPKQHILIQKRTHDGGGGTNFTDEHLKFVSSQPPVLNKQDKTSLYFSAVQLFCNKNATKI